MGHERFPGRCPQRDTDNADDEEDDEDEDEDEEDEEKKEDEETDDDISYCDESFLWFLDVPRELPAAWYWHC